MKKQAILFASTLTLVGLVGITTTANAAETELAKKETKANFTLNPNKNSKSYTIDADEITFKAVDVSENAISTDTDNTKHTITVNDFSGSAAGWKIGVSMTDFQNSDKSKKLTGAKIKYPAAATIKKLDGDMNSTANAPKVKELEIAPGEASATLVNAKAGSGKWTIEYGAANKIGLTAGTGNIQASYVSALTYSLTDIPEAW